MIDWPRRPGCSLPPPPDVDGARASGSGVGSSVACAILSDGASLRCNHESHERLFAYCLTFVLALHFKIALA